jgi:CoA-dependent NAD(P)H sulfur oxidoreductase
MRFLIIGGDAAGMSAASRAKRTKPDLDVTVLEKTEDVSYSACGMPYNIADAGSNIEDLVVRSADVFRKRQNINLLTGHQAEKIDPAGRTVAGTDNRGNSFQHSYDKLLIATGGRAIIPDIEGVALPGVMALKSLEDGRNIKTFLSENRIKRAVIIGMGYIALEMAEALSHRQISVTMIKPNPVFLPWMAADLAMCVRDELESKGVELHSGRAINKIQQKDTGLVVYGDNLELPADMVLVAIGIAPNAELAVDAGLCVGVGGAIAVDRTMQTSDTNIYAAGDCADAYHVVTGKKTWIPLALRANRAGWAVADAVCGRVEQLEGVAGTAVFKVFDLELARTGLSLKDAREAGLDPVETIIQSRSRAHAHPGASVIRVQMVGDRDSGRLLGVQMVGKEGVAHRINTVAVALHSGLSVKAFSQLDLAYAPPFGPVWDPLLTAASQLLKKMS